MSECWSIGVSECRSGFRSCARAEGEILCQHAPKAQNYTNPNLLPEQQDFSFWIQKAGFEEAAANRDEEDVATGGGTGTGNAGKPGYNNLGQKITTQPTFGDPLSTDSGPQGAGDIVTSGPNAGKRPVSTYDPINKTTTTSWE